MTYTYHTLTLEEPAPGVGLITFSRPNMKNAMVCGSRELKTSIWDVAESISSLLCDVSSLQDSESFFECQASSLPLRLRT